MIGEGSRKIFEAVKARYLSWGEIWADCAQEERYMDFGYNHIGTRTCWAPDRSCNPQYADVADIPWVGVHFYHFNNKGEICGGSITFDLPGVRKIFGPNHPLWQVIQFEPLTVAPSLLCRGKDCSDHGFIENGVWRSC